MLAVPRVTTTVFANHTNTQIATDRNTVSSFWLSLTSSSENVLLRECEGRTKSGLLAKSQQNREEKETTSMKKRNKFHGWGRDLDHFYKIPNPKILESFHTWEIPNTHSSDPCFMTPPNNWIFLHPFSYFLTRVSFLRLKVYYKKNYSAGNHRHRSRQTGRKPVHTCSEFCLDNMPDSRML